MPIMEEIEVYFTDDWGDMITDVFDWQMMLTLTLFYLTLSLNLTLLRELD